MNTLKKLKALAAFFVILCYLPLTGQEIEFGTQIHKCATFEPDKRKEILKELILRSQIHTKDEKSFLLNKIDIQDTSLRPPLQKQFASPSGRFLIHYDISGINAVDLTDNDGNGAPDYVDSVAFYFDEALRLESNGIGYHEPPADKGNGGSMAYDIYLVELGKTYGYYGYTDPEDILFPLTKFPKYISYIVIDNDFSIKDSIEISNGRRVRTYYTTGIDAVKITSVHELHHAIQYTYGLPEPSVSLFSELSSTWFEHRFYPAIKDYYQYLPALFNSLDRFPLSIMDGNNGYRWSIWGHYIYRFFGDSLLLRMWEIVEDEYECVTAMDMAFRERGTTFADEWCKFKVWMYYTGSRTKEGEYFEDAADMPEMRLYVDTTVTNYEMDNSGSMRPYEVRGTRYIFRSSGQRSDDTVDVILSNSDTESFSKNIPKTSGYNIKIKNSEFSGSEAIGNTGLYALISHPEFICIQEEGYSGAETNPTEICFPNPFVLGIDDAIWYPAPPEAKLYEEAIVSIMTIDLKEIYSKELQIVAYQGKRVIKVDNLPPDLTPGVYICRIAYNGNYSTCKLWVSAVRR